MKHVKKIISVLFVSFMMLNMISSQSSASPYGAYSGSITPDKINQGSEVIFTGSVFNTDINNIFVYAMNISFREVLGQSSVRDPKILNVSKGYDSPKELLQNNIFTDNFKTKISFNPGDYNVSIAFAISNGTAIDNSEWEYTYSLSNQFVEILGTSQSIKIARTFGYFVLGLTGLIIALFIRSKLRKK